MGRRSARVGRKRIAVAGRSNTEMSCQVRGVVYLSCVAKDVVVTKEFGGCGWKEEED